MKVLPVIHHYDSALTVEQAALAARCGADGVFLISHQGRDSQVLGLVSHVREAMSSAANVQMSRTWVGVNLLAHSPMAAYVLAQDNGADAVWMDNAGVSSAYADGNALHVASRIRGDKAPIQVFAGVAFKGQPPDLDPGRAARNAAALGFVPTTSGHATGHEPEVIKVQDMVFASRAPIAVASGLTVENLPEYRHLLSHAIVATGVSVDFHHFDEARLRAFVELAHSFNQP